MKVYTGRSMMLSRAAVEDDDMDGRFGPTCSIRHGHRSSRSADAGQIVLRPPLKSPAFNICIEISNIGRWQVGAG
jgi:hypothetical protein